MKYYYEVLVQFANGQGKVYYPEYEDATCNYTSFLQDGGWVFPRVIDGIEYPDFFSLDFVVGVQVSPFKGYRIPLKSGEAIYVKPPVTKERVQAAIEAEIERRQQTLNQLKAELNGHDNPVPVPSASANQGQPDAD